VACLIAVIFDAGHPRKRWAVTLPGDMKLCNAADAKARASTPRLVIGVGKTLMTSCRDKV
jgi:hypothetical protein